MNNHTNEWDYRLGGRQEDSIENGKITKCKNTLNFLLENSINLDDKTYEEIVTFCEENDPLTKIGKGVLKNLCELGALSLVKERYQIQWHDQFVIRCYRDL